MDSDDWEAEADNIIEDKPKEEVKTTKFDDEDEVDSDEERKKEEAKKAAAQNNQPVRVKTKAKDYDQMFEERQKPKKGPTVVDSKGKSKGAHAEALAKAAEEDITEQLFAADI
jgi:hypothetical protein